MSHTLPLLELSISRQPPFGYIIIWMQKKFLTALIYLCSFYIQYENFGHLQFVSDDKPNVF
mgnify:CR=1 FL=1